jgi:hypothetical protein
MPFLALLILPVLVNFGEVRPLWVEVVEEGILRDGLILEALGWGPDDSDLIDGLRISRDILGEEIVALLSGDSCSRCSRSESCSGGCG